jgi:multidrug efflux system membrane fusion protein
MTEGPLPVEVMGADGRTPVDSGKVLVIDNQVDQTTGTVRVKAEFPNTNLQLWPGQFVNVRLLIDTRRQVVVVPTAAVQRGPRGTFVFVIKDDNTVTVRQVAVAQQDDVQTVIGRGLNAGERVVTTGFARLAEGTKVEPSSAEEAGQLTPAGPQRQPRGEGKGKGKGGGKGKGKKGDRSPEAGTPAPGPQGAATQGSAAPGGAETTGMTGSGAQAAPVPGAQAQGAQDSGVRSSNAP